MSTQPAAFASMFDPQGQIRQVPQAQLQSALQSGGKYAVRVTDPQGVTRYIPHDMVQQAIHAGGKVAPDEPLQTHPAASQPGFWSGLGRTLLSTLASVGPTMSPTEAAIKSAEAGGHAYLSFQKAAEENRLAKEAEAAGRHGEAAIHSAGAAGYGLTGVLAPVGGGALESAGEKIGTPGQRAAGFGETAGLLAPVAAAHLLPVPKTAADALHGTQPEHVEALTGMIDDRAGKVNPHETATTVAPIVREQAARMAKQGKLKIEDFKARNGGGRVVTDRDSVFNKAIDDRTGKYEILRAPYAEALTDQRPIAQAIRDKITPEMKVNEPEAAAKLENEAKKFDKPAPLEQVWQLRERLNKELDAYENKGVTEQIMSDAQARAKAAARDTAAKLEYDTLDRLNGVEPGTTQRIQSERGALIEAKNSLQKEFNRASGQHGEVVSRGLRERIAGTYPSPRGVGHQVIRQFIGPKPLEVFNQRLTKMFGDLPENPPEPAPLKPPPPLYQESYQQMLTRMRTDLREAQVAGDTEHATLLEQQIRQTQQLASEHPMGVRGKPTPPKPAKARLQEPAGPSRSQQATLIMLAAKQGQITSQEADRQIQKLVGSGGRRTIRRPSPPE